MEENQIAEPVAEETVAPEETSGAVGQDVKEEEKVVEPKKYKLKVNGKEQEYDEETLKILAQKGLGADEKFQKAALTDKQAKKVLEYAKADPEAFLRELGLDPLEFSKKRLQKELEDLSLDPKEKELREYRKKVAEYEKQIEESKKKAEEERSSKAVEKWTQHYDTVLPDAIKSAGMPVSEDVIRIVTDIMITNLEVGVDLPIDQVMKEAKFRYSNSFKKSFKAAGENMLDLLDDDTIEALIQARDKKRGKTQIAKAKTAIQKDDEKPKPVKSYKENEQDFEERLKRWAAE